MKFHLGLGSKARGFFISSPAKKKPLDEEIQMVKLESGFGFRSADYDNKEETFFDSHTFLDSDCEDDFCSVNGDYTPSHGSTPNVQIGNATKSTEAFITDSFPDSKFKPSLTSKKKKLADLLQDSFYTDQIANEKVDSKIKRIDSPKQLNETLYFSASNSASANELKTPNGYSKHGKEKKNLHCCLPRLVSIKGRSTR
ncbi:hypothetical protein DsansV1_C27g0197491 [Dioscorea sansibarensis]